MFGVADPLQTMSPAQKKHGSTNHNLFDPSKSSTYKRLPGKTWKIQVSFRGLLCGYNH